MQRKDEERRGDKLWKAELVSERMQNLIYTKNWRI